MTVTGVLTSVNEICDAMCPSQSSHIYAQFLSSSNFWLWLPMPGCLFWIFNANHCLWTGKPGYVRLSQGNVGEKFGKEKVIYC